MDTIFSVKSLLMPNCFMASIDLRDAYLHGHSFTEVSEVCTQDRRLGDTSPVQSSPVRSVLIPKDFYQDRSRGPSPPQGRRYINRSILGRPSNLCQYKTAIGEGPGENSKTLRGPRMANKQGKIKHGCIPVDKIPGVHHRLQAGKDFSTSREGRKGHECCEEDPDKPAYLCQGSHVCIGPPHIIHSRGTVGTLACKGAPTGNSVKLVLRGLPGETIQDAPSGPEKTLVVEGSLKSGQRSTLLFPGRPEADYRCKLLGVGRPPRRADGPGELDSQGVQEVLQLEGTQGYSAWALGLQESGSGTPCPDPLRQRHSCIIYNKAGGHKEQGAAILGQPDSVMGRGQPEVHISSAPQRGPKCGSRFSEQGKSSGIRMESEPQSFSRADCEMGPTSDRPFCVTKQQQGEGLLLFKQTRSGKRTRCPSTPVGFPPVLRFSPLSIDPSGSKEIAGGIHESNPSGPLLAQRVMVCYHTEDGGGTPLGSSASKGSPNPGTSSASEHRATQFDRVVTEEQILKRKGLSDKLVSTLLGSRKDTTRAIYFKTWKRFNSWCLSKEFPPQEISSVLEFLHEGMELGLAASTLKTQMAALSVFLERRLSQEHLIIRFFLKLWPELGPYHSSSSLNGTCPWFYGH
ncbi:uncharacterized protein LOC143964250 [Lithobates pipiens]